MNQTTYTVLKLLLQQPLEEKELLKYLNINVFTLKKAITQINSKLVSLDLPIVEQTNTIYRIRLFQAQKELFFESCLEYSQNQRCTYLTLKLLINKTLNLEKEKENLHISRATIDRDIYIVKNTLSQKNIFIISKKWEGLFLNIKNNNNYYEYICEILITLYYEYKYLPGILKSFLVSLEVSKIEDLISRLFDICNEFNIQFCNVTFCYFLSLNICFNLFANFQLYDVFNYIKKIENNFEFLNIYKILVSKYHIKDNYALYVGMNIYDTLFKKFYLENSYKSKILYYCKNFNINLTNEDFYVLTYFLHISGFKCINKLYEVKNIYLKSSFDDMILDKLVKFLNDTNINLLYGDLLEFLDITKFFLLKTSSNNQKKVLILKKDVNITYFSDIKEKLKLRYPNFIFDINSYMYTYILEKQMQAYDLILSETTLDLDLNLKYKLCQINTALPALIDEYLIEDMLQYKNEYKVNI